MLLDNIGVIATALFSGVAAGAAVVAAWRANKTATHVDEIHVQINSRMDELVTLNKNLGHAEGVIDGASGPLSVTHTS